MTLQTTILSVRLPDATKAQLDKLAGHTRRSKSFLASEAIAAYVQRELSIVAAIEEGVSSMQAGRLSDHDEVMAEMDAIIEATTQRNHAPH